MLALCAVAGSFLLAIVPQYFQNYSTESANKLLSIGKVLNPEECWRDVDLVVPGKVYKCPSTPGAANITSFSELSFGSSYNRPWLYPPLKYSFCWIPKNSCSKIKKIFHYLMLNPSPVHEHRVREVVLGNYKLEEIQRIFEDDTWLRVFMVRDPVERFISGYLNKVVGESWLRYGNETYKSNGDDLKKFLERRQWMKNDHFAHQTSYCGIKNYPHYWNRLFVYESNTMGDMVLESSERRLEQVLESSIPGRYNQIFETSTKHATRESDGHSKIVSDVCCRNLPSLQSIYDAFAEDYEFFHLGRPTLCDKINCKG